jgi:hypothetical protein
MVVGFQMHTACKDQAIEKNRKGHEVGPRRRALQRAEAQTGLYRTSKPCGTGGKSSNYLTLAR